jgi:type 1 glutamine amidotransferase
MSNIKPTVFPVILFLFGLFAFLTTTAQQVKFKVLALYSTNVESDHVDFAMDAIKFYGRLAKTHGFELDTTSNWNSLNLKNLKRYQVVIWLNNFPYSHEQRTAFEKYMITGGAWLGFHVSGYNDGNTKWPWFVNFLGATFFNNNWPPLPAQMIVDDNSHPVTKRLGKSYIAPINEWYGWNPNPRDNKDIKVLVTLDPANYPLGKKDIIRNGDIPVVWTNTKYKMLYMNMGHGDLIFTSPEQNRMFEYAIFWLAGKKH